MLALSCPAESLTTVLTIPYQPPNNLRLTPQIDEGAEEGGGAQPGGSEYEESEDGSEDGSSGDEGGGGGAAAALGAPAGVSGVLEQWGPQKDCKCCRASQAWRVC